MRVVEQGGAVHALILSPEDFRPGVNFVSQEDWSLQVGLLQHPEGKAVPAHVHIDRDRTISRTQEFLYVIEGEVEVDFLDGEGRRFETCLLQRGEALLQVCGGHAFRFLQPSRVIEVKPGPYLGRDADKRTLGTAGGAK